MNNELKTLVEEIEKRTDAESILRSLVDLAETLRNQ